MQSTLVPTDQVLEELAGEAARQVADLWCRRTNEPLDAERVEDIANGIWECFNAGYGARSAHPGEPQADNTAVHLGD